MDVVWDPQTQMNSLDCWDYSIELSCLQGPEGRKDFRMLRIIRIVIEPVIVNCVSSFISNRIPLCFPFFQFIILLL